MSGDGERSALDALVREARGALVPRDPDWAALEKRLEAELEAEPNVLAAEVRATPARARVMRVSAMALAVAAAVGLVVKGRDGALLEAPPETTALPALSLQSAHAGGDVRVGGVAATTGFVVRSGDVIDVPRGAATFERASVASLVLSAMDEPARAGVRSAREPLVLTLERGAIEAEVEKVASGEAFAVDIDEAGRTVRVAVHGTHLRVARRGARVEVDLWEGVVSIGAPPRIGVTYGTLVTAPAHVTFDAAEPSRTLVVAHAPVRARSALHPADDIATIDRDTSRDAGTADAPPAFPPARSSEPRRQPETRPTARPESEGAAGSASARASEIVRRCAAANARASVVRVSVTSRLDLRLRPDGAVEHATFDPPLAPEIQECAAAALYAAKLPGGRSRVVVPIEFSYGGDAPSDLGTERPPGPPTR